MLKIKEYKVSDDYEDYNDFIKNAHYLEKNAVCPECNSSYVVHTSPFTHSLFCGDCGTSFNVTIKKEKE